MKIDLKIDDEESFYKKTICHNWPQKRGNISRPSSIEGIANTTKWLSSTEVAHMDL